jgi:hypothetical protein
MGYAKLKPSDFAGCNEETVISGALCGAVRQAMQAADAPAWIVRYALPNEDNPLETPGRQGKSRLRLDLEIERVCRGQRPLFRFEAKRLKGTGHPASVYLGEAGMGAFLSGEYRLTHPECGMIGYVQSDSESIWASKISKALAAPGNKFRVSQDGEWAERRLAADLKFTFRTRHEADGISPHITIFHVLLRFF